MNLSADEVPTDSDEVGTRDKPCKTCRRRKVRCSKTEPCGHCQRAGIACEYDEGDEAMSTRTAQVLSRRVSELEALVHKYQQERTNFASDRNVSSTKATQGSAPMQSPFAAERIMHELSSNGPALGQTPRDLETRLNGKLVLDGPMSRHVLGSFWASMYEEVGRSVMSPILVLADQSLLDPGSQIFVP